MRVTILGGTTKLGGYLAEQFKMYLKEVIVLGRDTGFDLLNLNEPGGLIYPTRGDVVILNAYSHQDPFAQGRCFERLVPIMDRDQTLIVIGSFAHHFPLSSTINADQAAYRAGKRFVHDVFVRYSTNQIAPRILLLEPGTIRHPGWPIPKGAEKTNYLKPEDVFAAITLFLTSNVGIRNCCWSIRGGHWPE